MNIKQIKKVTKNGKKQLCVDISYKDKDGKPHRKRQYFGLNERSEAEKFYFQFMNAIQEGTEDELTKKKKKLMTVSELFYDFIDNNYTLEDTIKNRISVWNNLIADFYGNHTIDWITHDRMVEFKKYIMKAENKNGNETTYNRRANAFEVNRMMVNYAMERGMIPGSTVNFNVIKGPKQIKKEGVAKAWEIEDIEKLINALQGDEIRNMVLMSLMSGTRKSELRGLKFGKVNFETNEIDVASQLKRVKDGDARLKNNPSYRKIALPETAMDILRYERQRRLDTGVSEDEIDDQYVFVNEKGVPFPKETLRRHYNNAIEKAGIEKLKYHALRATYTLIMIDESGTPTSFVSDLLGHSNDETTRKFYWRIKNNKSKRTYVKAADKVFSKTINKK